MNDEDLTPFRDDPLLLALRAPGTDEELTGEDAALAMFRQSTPARARRRRAITRATVGGAGIMLGLAMTTGVAAAYTTGLPDPVQDAVHAAIDPLPLPAPPTAHVLRIRHLHAKQAKVAKALAKAKAKAQQQAGSSPRPMPLATHRASAAPGGAPQRPSPRPSPATSPSPAPPRPTMSIAVSSRSVPVHGSVTLTGRLTQGTDGLAGRTVYAGELVAGQSTWRRVASGQTASDGSVSLTISPLAGNVRLRLVTGNGVISRQLPVAVVPKLTVRQARSGNDRAVTVSADGGRPGDALVLFRRDGDSWTQIATTTLADDDTGQFVVPGPGAAPVRYLVRLQATTQHAASSVGFGVGAR